MSALHKNLVVEAVALARTGHGVIITATTLAHLGEVATECRKLMGGKIERGRINDGGGGHIQFVLARTVCTAAFTPRNAAPDQTGVVAMYSPMAALPAGVKSVGDLAKQAVAHLTRGPIKGLVIDEGDATSHAPQYREPARKTRVRVKRSKKAKATK